MASLAHIPAPLVLLLLGLVVAGIGANPIGPDKYSGDWLAKELGMDDKDTATKALNDLKVGEIMLEKTTASGANKATSNAANSPQRDRDSFLAKMSQGRFDEALKELDSLIEKTIGSRLDRTNAQQVGLVASIRVDRIYALKALNRYIEALIEAQKIKQLIPRSDSRLSMLNNLIYTTEQELARSGPYTMLQIKPSENITKAYRKLMLLLHPDKNTNLDKETSEYYKRLYDGVNKSYEYLKSQS